MLRGIDISQYQGEVNFDTVKQNAEFVFIRSSFGAPDPGQSASLYTDPLFSHNQAESRRVGIRRGFYHFAYPWYNYPEAEANQFLSVIGELQEGELLALDIEDVKNKRLPSNTVEWTKKCLDNIASRTGVKPFLYINLDILRRFDWSSISSTYPLWLALWDNDPIDQEQVNWPAGKPIEQYGLVPWMNADGDSAFTDLSSYGKQVVHIEPAASVINIRKASFVNYKYGLNVRTGATIKDKILRTMKNGEGFYWNGVVKGDSVNGNNRWFLLEDGHYAWTGGTNYNPQLSVN